MKKTNLPQRGERVEVAARYVGKCEKLLDVGCGRGVIAFFLKGKVSNAYGIDNSRERLKEASKVGLITKYADLDKEKIPYEKSYFDTVTCLDVIEHVRDPVRLVKEIYRVLKRGGILILSTPNIRFSDHLVRLLIKGYFPITSEDKTAYNGGHIHYFTFSDLREILNSVGFSVVHEEGIINKPKRGIKGRIAEAVLGKKFMREFRSPGVLIVARKI